jgi:hypothetical protein
MIIEAGLTRYEAVNKEIEKQLEKQNKVTVSVISVVLLMRAKQLRFTALRATIWLAI